MHIIKLTEKYKFISAKIKIEGTVTQYEARSTLLIDKYHRKRLYRWN